LAISIENTAGTKLTGSRTHAGEHRALRFRLFVGAGNTIPEDGE
jgi:hypothetical protein